MTAKKKPMKYRVVWHYPGGIQHTEPPHSKEDANRFARDILAAGGTANVYSEEEYKVTGCR